MTWRTRGSGSNAPSPTKKRIGDSLEMIDNTSESINLLTADRAVPLSTLPGITPLVAHLHGAMEDLALLVALDLDPTTEEPAEGAIIHALRQPVAVATVLDALCALLGVTPPVVVSQAIGG